MYRILYPLLAVAILTARAVVRRTPAYRPVARLLAGTLAANAAQAALRWALEGARLPGEHYGWPAVAAFAVERALFVGYGFAVLALAGWALARHRGAVPLALWLGLTVAMAVTYQSEAPDPPTRLYLYAQATVAIGFAALAIRWAATAVRTDRLPVAALILGAGEVAMLGGPYLLGHPVENWSFVLISRGLAWSALIVLHLTLWRDA